MLDTPEFAQSMINFVMKEVSRNSIPAYLSAAVFGFGGMAFLYIIRGLIVRRLQAWLEKADKHGRANRALITNALKAFISMLTLLPLYIALKSLTFAPPVARTVQVGFLLFFTFMGIRVAGNLVGFLLDTALRSRKDDGTVGGGAGALLPIIKTLVGALGITFMLDNLGFQVSSIVAGLGIMGVAVGLAGQAILADFFSYLVILFDQPFAIGDVVTVGGTTGRIDHIGIKTTRIRALTGEVVVCPNADLTKQQVGNYHEARKRFRAFSFGVDYSTPVDKLKQIPQMLHDIAAGIPSVTIERAHFTSFADSSLNFDVAFSIVGNDGSQLLEAQHALNLGIVERFEQEGIAFAFPVRVVKMQHTELAVAAV